MTDKQARGDLLGILVIIALMYVVIFFFIPTLSSPVSLKIELQETKLSAPQDGVLFYTMSNNKQEVASNIRVKNEIVGASQSNEPPPLSLNGGESFKGKFDFHTSNLQKGDHIVRTTLNYEYQGQEYSEELTLGFTVY